MSNWKPIGSRLIWTSILFAAAAGATAQLGDLLRDGLKKDPIPTNLIREMAKQKHKGYTVNIVISGRSAEFSAQRLSEQLSSHTEREVAVSDIKIVMLDSYIKMVSEKKPIVGSQIFLCSLDDLDWEMPRFIRDLLGARTRNMEEQDSFVEAVISSDKPLSFRVLAIAPDEQRLEKISDVVFKKTDDHYSKLVNPGVTVKTHRSVLMGPSVFVENLKGWDDVNERNMWSDVALLPLDGNPDQPKESFWRQRSIVLFHDRSKNFQIPPFAAPFISAANYQVNEMRISRHKTDDGRSLYIYSAPTMAHLSFLAGQSSVHRQLLVDRSIMLKDLRSVGKGPMVVAATCTAELPKNALEDARAGMELYIRNELGLTVNPRGKALQAIEKELTLQSLQGKSDTITQLIKEGVKYLWLLELETPSSGIRGSLHLIDLSKGAGEVLISLPGSGSGSDLASAAKSAGVDAIIAVHSQALMAAPGVPELPPSVTTPAPARNTGTAAVKPPARQTQATVSRTSNGRIIVVDADLDWQVNDILSVPVPGSSAPMKIKVQSIETTYIICVPLVSAEKRLVAKIKANAPVKFERKS